MLIQSILDEAIHEIMRKNALSRNEDVTKSIALGLHILTFDG
jgi:hypothetical protein